MRVQRPFRWCSVRFPRFTNTKTLRDVAFNADENITEKTKR